MLALAPIAASVVGAPAFPSAGRDHATITAPGRRLAIRKEEDVDDAMADIGLAIGEMTYEREIEYLEEIDVTPSV